MTDETALLAIARKMAAGTATIEERESLYQAIPAARPIPEGQCHMKDCAAPSAYYVRAHCVSFDEALDSHDDGVESIPFCATCAAAVHAHGVPVYPLLAARASSLNA